MLMLFRSHHIIVYGLPAYTSGKTQLLDVVAFIIYKREMNTAISRKISMKQPEQLRIREYSTLLTYAYHEAFTRESITASFIRSISGP